MPHRSIIARGLIAGAAGVAFIAILVLGGDGHKEAPPSQEANVLGGALTTSVRLEAPAHPPPPATHQAP